MNAKAKAAILIVAVITASAVLSFVSVVAIMGKSDKIFRGVTVQGLHLGDMTRAEAREALISHAAALGEQLVKVTFDGGNGSFMLADAGFEIDANKTVAAAWLVGRRGNFLEQWRERKTVAAETIEIPLEFSISKDKLKAILDEMTKNFRVPPRDAKIVITPADTVQIVESQSGKGIDIEKAYLDLQDIVRRNEEPEIRLSIIEIKPAETTEDIKELNVNGLLAQFSTQFDAKKTNRVYNIKVAASALNGHMVRPGQEFSFNEVVGPRSKEAGYKPAPTILNREFIDSLGGGVCQVSTTLYNALLKADVDIVQRSNHSLVVNYVPLGQDAAVAYGGKDLKFKNNLSSALIIKTSVKGNTLTIKLYGDTKLAKSVRIVNNIIKEYPYKIVYKNDPTLPKGKQVVQHKGVKGYRVTSYMLITEPNGTVRRENLPSSYYAPQDEVVLVGTKPVSQSSTSGGGANQGGSKPTTTEPADGGQDTPTPQPDPPQPQPSPQQPEPTPVPSPEPDPGTGQEDT